jgi:cytochrome c-type biogenesis protein CcmF
VLILGRLALAFALVLALAAVALLAAGVRRRRPDLLRYGYSAAYGVALSSLVASAVLMVAFLAKDFSFGYVAENSDPTLSAFYRVAGFWAGQQGSFLLWLLMLALTTGFLAVRAARRPDDRLTAGAVLVLSAVCASFAALMAVDRGSDPFLAAPAGSVPAGLNPLLLHPAMVLHPPSLFLGYVGLAVPFAFAVSAMWQRRGDAEWVERSQRWALGGWLFLSLGIGLGAWWAYVILSWGGYWGWDPVENTSFIPWLTATAMLHSFTLYRRRGLFKHWALALAVVTFWLTILATWVTRSGVISSVHAFERRTVLLVVLSGFLVVVALVGLWLLVRSRKAFAGEHELQGLASRDFLYYVTNVGLSAFAAAVVFATVVVPLVLGQTVRAATYEALARPLGVLTLLAVGVCPLLDWKHTQTSSVLRRLAVPAAAFLVAVGALAAGGWATSIRGLIGLGVCAFTGTATLQLFVTRVRRGGGDQGLLTGLRRMFSGRRSRLGALVAHVGMAVVVAGLIGSTVYKVEQRQTINAKAGATAAIGGYRLTFVKLRSDTGPQGAERTYAVLNVTKAGRDLGQIAPHLDYFPSTEQTAARAVIMGGMFQDLFVSPEAYDQKQLTLQMDIFPLVRFVWIGAGLLVAGAGVSLWPRRRSQEVVEAALGGAAPDGRRHAGRPEEGRV